MDLDIVRPLPFTTVSGSAVDLPIANLANDRRGLVWRTADATGDKHIIIDLGAAESIDRVSLLRANVRSTATWRVRAGTTSGNTSSDPTYDSTAVTAWASTTLRRDMANAYLMLDTAHSARYWRIDISDGSHPDGYIEAGRLVIGKTFTPAFGPSFGSSRGVHDFSAIRRNPLGTPTTFKAQKFPRAAIRIDWGEAAKMAEFLALVETVGESEPVLIHMDASDTVDGMQHMYFGPLTRLRDLSYEAYDIFSTSFEVVAWM